MHLSTVGEVSTKLKAIETPRQIAAMRETLSVWNPLRDRLVGLWLDTTEGEWPCRTWPADWAVRRRAWLEDYDEAARHHTLNAKHHNVRSNFSILRDALERCPHNSAALSGRDVGRVRSALAATIARRGRPDSPRHAEVRTMQAGLLALPTRRQIARELVDRLSPLAADGGIPDPSELLAPAQPWSGQPVAVPSSLVRKVQRAFDAPIEVLVERGIIGSAAVLASVLPQMSAQVLAAGLDNGNLQALYAQIYAAFRRRRSVLLLNLEHQVRIDELPWVAALKTFRTNEPESRWSSRQTLTQTTLLTLRSFPQTMLPNPTVREIAALAHNAELTVPLVEEVAADIFMGTFTAKWRDSAAVTSAFLTDSLYSRYYDLPPPAIFASPQPARLLDRLRGGTEIAEDFAALCKERAKEAARARPARTGSTARGHRRFGGWFG